MWSDGGGGTNIFTQERSDGHDDFDSEEDVSKASKLSVGARILRGPQALKF